MTTPTPLQQAVAKYNAAFGTSVSLPCAREIVEKLAEIAQLRGRSDIAAELTAAIKP